MPFELLPFDFNVFNGTSLVCAKKYRSTRMTFKLDLLS